MEFKIFDNPSKMLEEIRKRNLEKSNSARIAAGFCWKWSAPRFDGSLVNDVKIGDFEMPWEKKNEFWKWATDDSGMEQVGTVYTAQGFEFDYIGVIFGNDLVYDTANRKWQAVPTNSYDSQVTRSNPNLVKHLLNTYRVLLSRAHKGVYVYFMDKEAEKFFKSRIEGMPSIGKPITQKIISPYAKEMISIPLVGSAPCGNPLVSEENIEEYIEVEKSKIKPGTKYFILRANGDSMNKAEINDGDLVLCRYSEKGETGDRVVALLGDNVTIKMYDKKNGRRILLPKSTNKSHQPIIPGEGDSVQGIVQEIIKKVNE